MKRVLTPVLLGVMAAGTVAAGQAAKGPAVEQCEKSLGTMAVNEPSAKELSSMGQYGLRSPSDLLRLLIEDSGCFVVVERGAAMAAMQQERQMARNGDLNKSANVGPGQMQAADYILTPSVVFSQEDSGSNAKSSIIGVIGNKVPGLNKSDLKFHEALTSLIVSDVRSGVQVAAAQGRATSGDLKGSAFGFQSSSFTSTSEGKVIAESLLRNFNGVVAKVRVAKGLTGNSGAAGVIGSEFAEGAILSPKMDGLSLLGAADAAASSIATLRSSDRLLSLGEVRNGYLHVQRGNVSGWVRQAFVARSDDKVATAVAGTPAATPKEGEILRPKIDNVSLRSAPKDTATAVAALKKTDEVVYLGEESGGYVKVQSATASGWVKLVLLVVQK